MPKFVLVTALIAFSFGAKLTSTLRYDDSDDPERPCFQRDDIEFDGKDGLLHSMRYKDSKDGDWKYESADGVFLDKNKNLLMCYDEEPSEKVSPTCQSLGAVDDIDFSMMGSGISYKDKTLTMDYGDEGSKVWADHVSEMEDELDITIYDVQNVIWKCDAKNAYDTAGEEAKVSDCDKAKVHYMKKDGKDAVKCLSSTLTALVTVLIASLY